MDDNILIQMTLYLDFGKYIIPYYNGRVYVFCNPKSMFDFWFPITSYNKIIPTYFSGLSFAVMTDLSLQYHIIANVCTLIDTEVDSDYDKSENRLVFKDLLNLFSQKYQPDCDDSNPNLQISIIIPTIGITSRYLQSSCLILLSIICYCKVQVAYDGSIGPIDTYLLTMELHF
jgi:hypothetical protein